MRPKIRRIKKRDSPTENSVSKKIRILWDCLFLACKGLKFGINRLPLSCLCDREAERFVLTFLSHKTLRVDGSAACPKRNKKWSIWDSNPRPPQCECGALPAALMPHRNSIARSERKKKRFCKKRRAGLLQPGSMKKENVFEKGLMPLFDYEYSGRL